MNSPNLPITERITVFGLILCLGIATSFMSWWPGGETWGYWYFSKILAQTGEFIIFDRSPLYVSILTFLNTIKYPLNIIIHNAVLAIIISASFLYLCKGYAWWPIIFILSAGFTIETIKSEPPTLGLAMALLNFSIGIRLWGMSSNKIFHSYILMIISFLIRPNFIVPIIIFAAYDLYNQKQFELKNLNLKKIKINHFFLVALVSSIFIIPYTSQSTSPINNAWFTSTSWKPTDGKSMASASFFQSQHARFIEKKKGLPCCDAEKSFYYSELGPFPKADGSIIRAILENPQFIFTDAVQKTHMYTELVAKIVAYRFENIAQIFPRYTFYYAIVCLLIITFCTFNIRSVEFLLLLISFIVMSSAIILLNIPKDRYITFIFPIFLIFYLNVINVLAGLALRMNLLNEKYFKLFAIIIAFIIFKFFQEPRLVVTDMVKEGFSNGPITHAQQRVQEILRKREIITFINSYSSRCDSILTTTDMPFIGAFSSIDLGRINDYWIFPPSSRELMNADSFSEFDFDCIFVNDQISGSSEYRYKFFVLPLEKNIVESGGRTEIIPGYGRITFK